jgi:hypothetical protein
MIGAPEFDTEDGLAQAELSRDVCLGFRRRRSMRTWQVTRTLEASMAKKKRTTKSGKHAVEKPTDVGAVALREDELDDVQGGLVVLGFKVTIDNAGSGEGGTADLTSGGGSSSRKS